MIDHFWERFLHRFFLHVVFINGSTSPPPPHPVDVLLLSKVTLGQYNIRLYHCSVSLILSNPCIRTPMG